LSVKTTGGASFSARGGGGGGGGVSPRTIVNDCSPPGPPAIEAVAVTGMDNPGNADPPIVTLAFRSG
jgi:hypothetical protein